MQPQTATINVSERLSSPCEVWATRVSKCYGNVDDQFNETHLLMRQPTRIRIILFYTDDFIKPITFLQNRPWFAPYSVGPLLYLTPQSKSIKRKHTQRRAKQTEYRDRITGSKAECATNHATALPTQLAVPECSTKHVCWFTWLGHLIILVYIPPKYDAGYSVFVLHVKSS